jgi:predicted transcriptional regulator
MVSHMKTTIDLPDELLREAQLIARAEGTTLKSVMEEGLRAVIARHRTSQQYELRDASVSGRGLQPEFADADWSRIRQASYGGRL